MYIARERYGDQARRQQILHYRTDTFLGCNAVCVWCVCVCVCVCVVCVCVCMYVVCVCVCVVCVCARVCVRASRSPCTTIRNLTHCIHLACS